MNDRQIAENAAQPGDLTALTTELTTRLNSGEAWSSFYGALENPDPILRNLGYNITIYDRVARDGHISSCMKSRKAGAVSRKWMVSQDNGTDGKAVEILTKCIKSLNVPRMMREMLDAIGYGYSVLEIIWQRQGDLILPVRVTGKPQSWFWFDVNNDLRRRSAPADITGIPIEAMKFLLVQHESNYNNPYGHALYGQAFWPMTMKMGDLKFWAKFLEKFSIPHPIGKLPRGAPAEQVADLMQKLRLLISDAVAVVPDDASITTMDANDKTASSDLFERFAKYHDDEISKIILGHTAGATATPGKLGGEDGAMEVRRDLVDADAGLVEEAVNTLIGWIGQFNPSIAAAAPSFCLYEEEDVDKVLSERDATLANANICKFTKPYLTKAYGFAEEDIEVPAAPALPPGPPAVAAPAVTQFSSPTGTVASGDPGIDQVDAMAEQMAAGNLMDAMIGKIDALLQSSGSLEEFKNKLLDLYGDLDAATLGTVMQKAMTTADLSGRYLVRQTVRAA